MVDPAERDEALVAALRGALDPSPVAPSLASVQALRLAVLERWGDLDAATGPARGRRWPRRSAVLAAVTTALTLGGGTVAFAHPALPRPLREVARMAGLPVSVEPAARVRLERAELERSLDVGNVTRVRTDLEDLNRAESKLTASQQVGARAADEDLEQRARTVIGGPAPAPVGESEGSDTAATPAPAHPEPTEAQPASSPPAPAAGDDRASTTTTAPGGQATGRDGSTEPAPAPSSPSPQETPSPTTTSQPPSSSDDGHSTSTSMSTSSAGGELLQTTTVDH